jgi:hypothetical protein
MKTTTNLRLMPVSAQLANEGDKLTPGTIAERSHELGLAHGEPLTLGMDGLLRYAVAYRAHYDQPLSEDYVLGPYWLKAASGLRALLCGDGAVAMEQDIATDSKDNSVVEGLFWAAMREGGFGESDLD